MDLDNTIDDYIANMQIFSYSVGPSEIDCVSTPISQSPTITNYHLSSMGLALSGELRL